MQPSAPKNMIKKKILAKILTQAKNKDLSKVILNKRTSSQLSLKMGSIQKSRTNLLTNRTA
jgi:hypothetical protein